MIKLAIQDSNKFSGIAIYNIPFARTRMIPITTHMSTKPINQEGRLVSFIIDSKILASLPYLNCSRCA